MNNFKVIFKYKWKVVVTMFFILVGSGSIYFFQEKKQIKENVIKAETKLTESGFDKLYVKEDNELCVEETDKQKQEDISRDMLWTLELEGKSYKKIEKINCKNGNYGIKIK